MGEFSSCLADMDDQFNDSVRVDAEKVAEALAEKTFLWRSSSADMVSSSEEKKRSQTR